MSKEKTHWLQNPNKHYLGHWDLPGGKDVILTIASANWEKVVNPITRTAEALRVIRFKEEHPWLKPFICNQVNAQAILKVTGEKFMDDCEGKKIKLSVGQTKIKGEEVDCLRVKIVSQSELSDEKISPEQVMIINKLIEDAGREKSDFCAALKINAVPELPKGKFDGCVNQLNKIISKNSKNANNN